MAIQTINIGSSANKGDGDPLRTAFKKINENFAELDTTNTIRDIKGSVFGDDSTLLVDGVNNLIPSSVLSGSLPAIDGSALTGITATTLGGQNASYYLDYTNFTNTPTLFSGAFADLTSKPTTLSGYGISDAYTKTEVDSAISSSVLTSGSTHSIDIVAADSTLLVDSVNGTLNATTLVGNLPALDGSALTDVAAVTSNTTVFTARADVNLLMGEVVYLTGISGNTPTIDKAQANSASTMPAFGIVKADVSANNNVEVITFGSCPGHDAANFGETGITFALGDTIYVSATEAGKLTNVAPAGESNLIQNIGKIERATPTTNMTIKVGGAGRTNATPALDEGNIFIGNAQNKSSTTSFNSTVDAHLNQGTAGNNEVLSWNGSDYAWVAQSGGGGGTGDIQGSVFADDSTLLVDGVNGKITGEVTGTISSTNWMASSDSYLTIANGGATGPGPIQIVASANLDLTSGNNNDINITPHGTGRVKVSDTAFGIVEASTFMGHTDQFMYLSSKTTGTESTHIALNSTSGVQTTMYGAVDFVSGGSVDFTGSTVTGLNVTGDATVSGNLTAGTGTVGGLTFAGTQIASDDSTQISFQDNIEIAGGPVISGSSLTHTGTFTVNPYALNLTTTGGNVHVQASNYVILDSTNNGQINIGLASGIGDVLIGNESNGTSVQLNGRTMFTAGMEESYNSLTGQSGVVAHDCADGHMFYHTSTAGDITANFTNLGLAVGHATNLTIVIDQGNTAHEITAVQIGGAAQTIVWQGNSAPTGTANGVDSFSFTILRLSGSYVVLGQMVAFGGV